MFVLLCKDGDNSFKFNLKRYDENGEKFILLANQEINQDSYLKTIEFGYYTSGIISIMVLF